MSRGLGKCERAVLECLYRWSPGVAVSQHASRTLSVQRLLSETEIGKTQLSRALRSLERKGLVHLYSNLFLGRRRYAADGTRGSYIMMQPRDPQFGNVKAAELRAEGKAVASKVRQSAAPARPLCDPETTPQSRRAVPARVTHPGKTGGFGEAS